MNVSSKSLLALSFVLASSAFASRAHAGDAASAEALFDEARRLMTAGNFVAACPQLEESQKLDPGMGTLYNLADCYEKTGRVASAWAAFLDVAAQAKNANQAPREADARARAAALDPKLSRLTIVVAEPAANSGVAIKRDGTSVGKAQWGIALPIDPGVHTIEVSAPGKKSITARVEIAPNGANVPFAVPTLEDATPDALPIAPPPPVDQGSDESNPGQTQRIAGLAVAGVGVVSLGVGSFFGLRSISKKNTGDSHCVASGCDQTGVDARKSAISAGNLSTVFFIIAPVAIAGGLALYFTSPKARTAKSAFLAPVVSTQGGGLSFKGSFE